MLLENNKFIEILYCKRIEVITSLSVSEKENKIEIDGNKLAPGIYFYTLWVNGEFIAVKKMERTK
ncbi:MAG: hypothetical protein COA97_11170 [Flavobacteriales bacterium]|nr:MAG: hypothetical protein COA97_11170 [Flavobacteriales bacterium]